MKTIFLIIGICALSLSQVAAQESTRTSIPIIGAEAPAFIAQSTNGEINFPSDFGKSWKILFSHPRDFTPVCSSEILELAYQQEEFKSLNTNIVVVSTDELNSHISWKAALELIHFKGRESVQIDFPLVADNTYKIVKSYGMLDGLSANVQSIRGVFFIDPENKIRAFTFYPNEVGRNSEEIKRTLLALQTSYNNNRLVMPSNWQPGDDVMLPFLNDTEKADLEKTDSKIYQSSWFMTYLKSEE